MKCYICDKEIPEDLGIPLYMGRVKYMCPECNKRAQCSVNSHEIVYWNPANRKSKGGKKKNVR